MAPIDRLTRLLVRATARRWPDDLAAAVRDEWLAELAAITGPRRAYRKLAFAGSLAISPAVDEPSWPERAGTAGRAAAVAAGITLVAAVATNAARGSDAFAPALLLLAVAGVIAIGRRIRGSVTLVGLALFAFLFAGNPTPVMPFMGAADIAPAVAVWAVGMTVALRRTTRWATVSGGLVTLHLATMAGSAHAAAALGVPAWTAPAWFPLALLPGGTVAFGPLFNDGTATFGALQASAPAFHASDILLANAAVSAGPLLLCTAFLLAPALRRPRTAGARIETPPAPARTMETVLAAAPHSETQPAAARTAETLAAAGPHNETLAAALAHNETLPAAASSTEHPPAAAPGRRLSPAARETVAGLTGALAALAVAPLLPAAGADADVVLQRMIDNTTAFGFGFVEHPLGLGAVALLTAVLAMRATAHSASPTA
ncbi:hypothetical protein [Paractinoplanes maris]|uniref:hypothetical protein n=1 Tax=Paractinoplanes maris TaxID=1734446 RepID=UPI00202010A8|nr:hypothetical protein [Actinoplanes maris]